MAYNPVQDNIDAPAGLQDIASWAAKYTEQDIDLKHDALQYDGATPDEAIIVVGPPRLRNAKDGFSVVGLVQSISYAESSNIQPMKAVGSRRWMFSKSNNPVSGNIGRVVAYGPNLAAALYRRTNVGSMVHTNSKFSVGTTPASGKTDEQNSAWYTNLEDDIYRIPFGLGVIYMSPRSVVETNSTGSSKIVGADYLENVILNHRSTGVVSGQALIMEQVSFMADRVVPFNWNGSVAIANKA